MAAISGDWGSNTAGDMALADSIDSSDCLLEQDGDAR